MNSTASAPPPAPEPARAAGDWSRGRWWSLVGFVLLVHLGFIFAFGERSKPAASAAVPPARLRLRGETSEWLALQSPALFALPNLRGVAGQTWLKPYVLPFAPFRWTEPPRLLSPSLADLGTSLGRFTESNALTPIALEARPEPEALEIGGAVLTPAAVTNSRVRLARELADRPWLNQPALPSWTGTNLLANTIVQALVDQTGRVLSTTLLAGAGQREVDDYALELVRQARFETRPGAAVLALGTLVFEWHAAPPPSSP